MRRDECVSHVRRALEMAVSRDGASGGVIRLCIVSAKGVERWTVVPRGLAAGAVAAAAAAAEVEEKGELKESPRESGRWSGGGGSGGG